MLRTNLSTRPFYNIRAVTVALGAMAALVALLTIVNLVQLYRLTTAERAMGARVATAEGEAGRLRADTQRIRGQINNRELTEVAAAAAEAQSIIDLRLFSWSHLLSEIEGAMPADVRLTSFQPRVDRDGRFRLSLRVEARRVQDLEAFLDAMEETGVFQEMLATEEQTNPAGAISAQVEGVYLAPSPAAPPEQAAAASPEGHAGD